MPVDYLHTGDGSGFTKTESAGREMHLRCISGFYLDPLPCDFARGQSEQSFQIRAIVLLHSGFLPRDLIIGKHVRPPKLQNACCGDPVSKTRRRQAEIANGLGAGPLPSEPDQKVLRFMYDFRALTVKGLTVLSFLPF